MTAHTENEGLRVRPAPACPLCGGEGEVLYTGMRDRVFSVAGVWSFRLCRACGLAWLDPQPLPEEIGKLYEEYVTHSVLEQPHRTLAGMAEQFRNGILRSAFGYQNLGGGMAAQILGRLLAWVAPMRDRVGGTVMWLTAHPGGRLLDVGCGNGEFLARMRALGWSVAGVEPDPAAARLAREKFGLDITLGSLPHAELSPQSFDAVATNHVFEHVLDPVAFLRDCRDVLKTGGRLTLTTPNLDSLGHRWGGIHWVGLDPPRHLMLFTRRALAACAERGGLRILELRSVARLASWMWVGTRYIERLGRFALDGLQNRGPRLWMEGLTVLGMECALAPFSDVGEELLLVATRD
jgi:2-polyprenyl-3-methyl-5-hydroxy-6-metoxy-1,4-benzoquinol methylase